MVRRARPADNACLTFARMWEYPLWCGVIRSEAADAVSADVDWWMRCINDEDLLALDRYSRFATTDVYVEGGVVRGIYIRDTIASESTEPQLIRGRAG